MILTIHITRKPVIGSVASNVLKWETGGINIDGCRISFQSEADFQSAKFGTQADLRGGGLCTKRPSDGHVLARGVEANRSGRYPANLVLSHLSGCECVGEKRVRGTGIRKGGKGARFKDAGNLLSRKGHVGLRTDHTGFTSDDGTETVADWNCAPDCPVCELDQQSGNRPGMSGGGAKDQNKKSEWVVQPYNRQLVRDEWIRSDTGGASRFFKQVKEE